ncbi:MAG: anaerobic ribonucleoside-triphosphate reductase activating protein [Prevotella sp.]|nr:anaerobic ribonucleoside-triphosphate reductase activating protein [Prevotella sp.]MBR7043534.1 anaerobic ribonucleoside-triphosphate reductase activating protein [Prevotella sp.]MBR7086847.1 anaerobic ribonucleoside-triphosphate reductase activating protein [Prevotella sp.]
MLKYVNTGVVFQEIPDETTLSVNISRCPCHCPGCHSSYLAEDIGEPLDEAAIDAFVSEFGADITCIALMGGDAEPETVDRLACYIRERHPRYRVAWYSGRIRISPRITRQHFDYIKIGPYIAHLGSLSKPTTNQRLYKVAADGELTDITARFWKK